MSRQAAAPARQDVEAPLLNEEEDDEHVHYSHRAPWRKLCRQQCRWSQAMLMCTAAALPLDQMLTAAVPPYRSASLCAWSK